MTSYAVRNIDEVSMEREMVQINNFMQNVESEEAAVQASIDSYINGGGFVAEYYDADTTYSMRSSNPCRLRNDNI